MTGVEPDAGEPDADPSHSLVAITPTGAGAAGSGASE